MANISGTTRAQTIFLRAFRTSTFGPAAESWPSPAVLRRWLRSRTFAAAMASVQKTLRFAADFQLQSAASAAAQTLHSAITCGDLVTQARQIKAMSDLLKLAHLRQRFATEDFKAPIRDNSMLTMLRRVEPDLTVQELLEMIDRTEGDDQSADAQKAE